jgi:hypothetical protein
MLPRWPPVRPAPPLAACATGTPASRKRAVNPLVRQCYGAGVVVVVGPVVVGPVVAGPVLAGVGMAWVMAA